jgi:NAD(P)-dependent dehydrogenase (short-subunit alcohol dehydrogenase family)
MSAGELDGKVAIVTGAAGGIGSAVVATLVAAGAKVVAADLDDSIERLEQESGGRIAALRGDVSDAAVAEQGVALARDRFGSLDILVNNAARFLLKPLIDTSDEEWDGLFNANVRSVLVQTRAALPALIERRGAIVNLASISGVLGLPDQAAYCATKGAIVQITRQVAIQHARDGVRVNAVAPGAVDTLFVARSLGTESEGSGINDEMTASHPLGRVAQPQEIAEVVLFLASPRSSVMTGAIVMADCGYSVQ